MKKHRLIITGLALAALIASAFAISPSESKATNSCCSADSDCCSPSSACCNK